MRNFTNLTTDTAAQRQLQNICRWEPPYEHSSARGPLLCVGILLLFDHSNKSLSRCLRRTARASLLRPLNGALDLQGIIQKRLVAK